ncbi:RagB/SusD family nutrient uptake outer membrane protein [Chryseosolibacter indicus]|uniref:RagB/SusD family nutrient uptake outer membrane protein n=1 Tax=Chryseosolibacter indicus TaxID=2782351 RepID=A0ABS5VRY5_9BACT|nr:RagB/SusD family nutrient uptake outer membrane protein [Chryseosolibacter indicus]MBT1703793.1 RagB/SusD family nutrient uptake outer membrane protein [Chryseosolibacter indicus]
MLKKNIAKGLLVLVTSALLFTACDDFLSETPDNRATVNTKEKIAELLVSAYPEGNYIPFCEAMSDNVEDNFGGTQDVTNADPYFWRDGAATWQDSPENYWNACYAAIAAANHALKAIRESNDSLNYNAQKGEALIARAYSHFMLVSLFAKMYNPQTADIDPGIPYVTDLETVSLKTYERKTVQYVYDMIEKDLIVGLPLINDQSYGEQSNNASNIAKFHFTKAAAHAFASRYYLYKKQYDKVVEHADRVLMGSSDVISSLRPWTTIYRTYTTNELSIAYTRSTEKANLLLCETQSDWGRTFNKMRYSTGAGRMNEMIFQFNPAADMYAYSYFYTQTGINFIHKFREHFVRIGTNATTGYIYTILPLFTTEEVLLNRAEAYAMQSEFRKALDEMNRFISVRVLNYDPERHNVTYNRLYNLYKETDNKKAIVRGILELRRIEFLHEGLRWFDILRHQIPVFHTTIEGQTLELKPSDPRRILQIPAEAISVGGLEPNPRH